MPALRLSCSPMRRDEFQRIRRYCRRESTVRSELYRRRSQQLIRERPPRSTDKRVNIMRACEKVFPAERTAPRGSCRRFGSRVLGFTPLLPLLVRSVAPLRTPVNNIEYFPPNFEGLVLGCIDADFCKYSSKARRPRRHTHPHFQRKSI